MRFFNLSFFRSRSIANGIAALVFTVGSIHFTSADESQPLIKPVDDLRLELRAKQAIRESSELSRWNPGLKVEEGVAILWGNLPSPELVEELVRRIKRVEGIRGVQSEVRIVSIQDDLPDRIAKAVAQGKPVEPKIAPMIEPQVIVREPQFAPVMTTSKMTLNSARLGTTVMKPDPMKLVNLDEWLTKATKTDLRYQKLTWEISEGVIRLRGQVDRMGDIWDLADRISDLEGVRRVLVDGVRAR